jgi:tRNA nucleotidyltransferase (CCA-adding enzyme)
MIGQLDGVASALRKLSVARELAPSEIYRILNPLVIETLLLMMAIGTKDEIRRSISLFITRLKAVRVEVSGNDLRSLGIEPGEIYSVILDDLLMRRLDGKVADRESEITYVRKAYGKQHEPAARIISP